MRSAQEIRAANARLARRLALVVVGMFGFGYALVPLYDVLCEVTGLNGKTGAVRAESLGGTADESRTVTVEFLATVNGSLPWEFRPLQKKLRVHPGRLYRARFMARNLAGTTVIGQAIPSVSPSIASLYFNKTECFCFTQQSFAPGERREMPVQFQVGKDLPAEITTVTLAYTFFNVGRES